MKDFAPDFFFDRSFPEPNSGCWVWLNAIGAGGYGVVNIGSGKVSRAHRASYMSAAGKRNLPSSVDVCHRCDNRLCVNPDHLFEGTRTDNMRDCANKGRVVLPGLRGEQLPQSKLTEEAVLAILSDGRSTRELGRVFGVNRRTISLVRQRKIWRHVA